MIMVCVYIFQYLFSVLYLPFICPSLCMCSASDELAEVYLPLQEIDADKAPTR